MCTLWRMSFITSNVDVGEFGKCHIPDGDGMSLTFFYSAPFHLRTVFVNAGLPDCPAFGQSGTGKKKNADAGTSPVPE